MGKERISKPRKMLPQFLVICEGETEEAYVNLLKRNYRLPIKIVPKIIGSEISDSIVNRYKKELTTKPELVSTFLIYDGDVPLIVERVNQCNGKVLISKPCIELWFLAHYKDIPDVEISTEECLSRLKTLHNWKNYKKANFSIIQQQELWENRLIAVRKMNSIPNRMNTYSQLSEFIEKLETVNKKR